MKPSLLYGSPSTSSSSAESTTPCLHAQLLYLQILQLLPPLLLLLCLILSTPTSTAPSTSTISNSPFAITNPLVAAGLVSPDLMDTLQTPTDDAAVAKKSVPNG